MFRKSQAFGLLALSALVFLAAGCGGNTNPATVAVNGTLLYEDVYHVVLVDRKKNPGSSRVKKSETFERKCLTFQGECVPL